MSIKIDKGIPVPGRRACGPTKYPWNDMEVGDSFLVPFDGMDKLKLQGNLSSAACHRKRRYGEAHTTSRTDGGMRVWRTK